MHDLLVVGVPLLAILAGIFFNNSNSNTNAARIEARFDARIDKVEARLDKMQADIMARIDRIQADLAQFYGITSRHETKIEALEKKA